MPKRSSIRKKPGPKDLNQLAKSIVDQATGNAPPPEEPPVGDGTHVDDSRNGRTAADSGYAGYHRQIEAKLSRAFAAG